jgi:hypothetical protein
MDTIDPLDLQLGVQQQQQQQTTVSGWWWVRRNHETLNP